MRQFKYTAINLQKEKFAGKFIARDEKDLAVQLSKQGLFLMSARPYSGKTRGVFFTAGTGKVNPRELTMFCRQFAIMINAGISILNSLDILKEQPYGTYFRSLLEVMAEDVKAGMMFSEALDKHRKVFPVFFVSMIKVGETSGRMDIVLNSLADYYEKDMTARKKIKAAFAYPAMLAIMTVAITALMLLFVVPTFRESLASLELQPEGITKVVYDISDFLIADWLNITACVVVLILVLFFFGKTKRGSLFYDKIKARAPVFKKINGNMTAAKFARGFGLLLSSGLDIKGAMEVIAVIFGNKDMENRFGKAAEDVKHGVDLSVAFDKYKLFPPILIQMVAVGEKTNALDEVLTRSCSFFDEQAEATITSLTSKIQPVMLAFMGLTVGIMFIAVYSPMITIMTSL